MDADDSGAPVSFKSYEERCVTSSVLAAEVITSVNLCGEAFPLRETIELKIDNSVQLVLLIHSKSLIDAMRKGNRASDRWLMLNVYPTPTWIQGTRYK